MENYNKDECLAFLRDSADAHSFRMELLISGGVLLLWLLISLLMLFESVASFSSNARIFSILYQPFVYSLTFLHFTVK